MKLRNSFAFLFLFYMTTVIPLAAQTGLSGSKWEMVGLINFTSIARQSPTTIVATTTHGYLYYSTNNGDSWLRRELNDTLALTDIAFLDSLHCVVTDRTNNVLVSSDGGATWSYTQLSDKGTRITCVAYPSSNTIFVADTAGTIWRTLDAGKTAWTQQLPSTTIFFNRLYFLDKQNGFALGNVGSLFKTTDAGDHWLQQDITNGNPFATDGTPIDLYSIDFHNTSFGIIGALGYYYTTTDAGANWKSHTMPSYIRSPLYTVKLLNDSEFFALGLSGQVYHAYNFVDSIGATLLNSDGISDVGSTRSAVYDPINGVIAVGDASLIMKSSDEKHWIPINQCLARQPMESVGNGILHCMGDIPVTSTDGGIFWNGYKYQNELDFIGLHFTSRDSGFLINRDNFDWLRTSDDCRTWTVPIFSPEPPFPSKTGFFTTSFSGRNTGYVAGDTIIMHTSDNGFTWNTATIAFDRSTPFEGISKPWSWFIEQVQAIDNQYGFAVLNIVDTIFHPAGGQYIYGNNHIQIFRTIDAGSSWVQMQSVPALPNGVIDFINRKIGFIASDSGVYKTVDGGDNWTRIRYTPAVNNFIYGFRFLNDSIGFISYRYDGLLSTKDGGKTWVKEIIHHPSIYPEPILFSDFIFPDSNSVLAISAGVSGAGFFKKTFSNATSDVRIDYSGDSKQQLHIRLYPNPSTEILHCELDGYADPSGNLSAAINDILGRQIIDLSLIAHNNSDGVISSFTVDVGKLSPGVYTLRYRLDNFSNAKQFIVVH